MRIVVVDTNILFSAFYAPDSNASILILLACEGMVKLFAPESVRIEIERVLRSKLAYKEEDIDEAITSLPINWVEESLYSSTVKYASTIITHEKDIPVLACALALGHDIVSGDRHLLSVREDIVKVWKLKDLIDVIIR